MFDHKLGAKRASLQEFYTQSAMLYYLDPFIWTSMTSDKDMIFYQKTNDDWVNLKKCYEVVELGSEH